MPTKRARVHYRRYHRTTEPAVDQALSTAVAAALGNHVGTVAIDEDVGLRTYRDPEYGSVILNGRFRAASGDVYGELVQFDPEANIPLLMQNSTSKGELEIRELVKPNDAEVLRGMNFFLLREDHVLVIEQGVTNTVLERYLRWFLAELGQVAKRNTRIPLIPKLFLGDRVEAVPDVKMIRLKPGPVRVDEFDFQGQLPTSATAIPVETTTDVFGILRAANFDTTVIERVMRESGAAVEMNLTITLKAGRSTAKMEGEDAIALLRHVPEDDLVVIGEGFRRNRGVLERLSHQVDIERRGNILDRKDAWRALREAAGSYRDAGLIE